MKKYLKEQGITLSPRVYFIDALGAMAFGLFVILTGRHNFKFYWQYF